MEAKFATLSEIINSHFNSLVNCSNLLAVFTVSPTAVSEIDWHDQ